MSLIDGFNFISVVEEKRRFEVGIFYATPMLCLPVGIIIYEHIAIWSFTRTFLGGDTELEASVGRKYLIL